MNRAKLNEVVARSGLKKKVLAEKSGMCAFSLARKLDGTRKFEVDELNALVNALGVNLTEKCEIFFTQ